MSAPAESAWLQVETGLWGAQGRAGERWGGSGPACGAAGGGEKWLDTRYRDREKRFLF